MPQFDVDNVFCYHPPFGDQAERYVALREKAKELARLIQTSTPASREQSLALTDLQRVVMMANAAIAINEPAPPVPVATQGDPPPGSPEDLAAHPWKRETAF